jgi:hypothetical protein
MTPRAARAGRVGGTGRGQVPGDAGELRGQAADPGPVALDQAVAGHVEVEPRVGVVRVERPDERVDEAAASWRAQLTFSLTLRMRRVVPAGEDPHHGQDHQPEDERPDGSPLLAPGLPPDSGAEHDQDQDDTHALIVAAAAGACKPCRARERFQAVPKLIDAAEAERGCHVLPTRMPRVCRVSISLFDYMPQRCPFGHEP